MSNIVTYSCKEGVATITMDDGKVNALSHTVWDELGAAFDKAEAANAMISMPIVPGNFSR